VSASPATPSAASSAPRWGVQGSIVQPRQPAFWLFVVMLAIGGCLFIQEQSLMAQLETSLTLSWTLVLIYAVPVALIVYRLDLFEREPKIMLAAALLWGGVVAASLAGYANEAWLSIMGKVASPDVTAQWGAAVVGPGVEETLKLMGVIVLFLIVPTEFDGPLDGFVYGAMVGLGFTVVEDVSYFIHAAAAVAAVGDQTTPVIDTFLVRVVGGGLYSHVLFTGITGLGFAFFVTRPRVALSKRLLGFGTCVVAGVAAHATWNSPWMQSVLETTVSDKPSTFQWIEYGALKGMPFLLLLVVLVVLATRDEERNFRLIVAGEPDPMVVTEPEIASLGSLLSRRVARSAARRQLGPMGAKLVGQLQSAQIEYAMIRSRVDSLSDPALEAQRRKIRGIRAGLGQIPATATATVAATSVAQFAPAGAPIVATPPAPTAAWRPTHLVPPGGMAAYGAPNPASRPIANLPERLELVVETRAADWAMVRAVNGWRGWVDGRLLLFRG
jgi:RsiW-degrading membrane proteinase PrsW (M82 family)